MTQTATNVAVLGSTGSIGTSTLEVVAASGGLLKIVALAARSSTQLLLEQARRFRPQLVVVADEEADKRQDWSELPAGTKVLCGQQALAQIAAAPEVDIVMAAIVGAAGLQSTWAAVEAGKTVALANKETLVMAGPQVMQLAAHSGAQIVPVDSEHSAVFQCLQAGQREEVKRIILTASGGPFRNFTAEQMARVTVEQALAHPTWDMGPKITIDSATLMNKALEIVEARWLFDLAPEQIDVVIHPQSIVHSLVEFVDGSMVAQLGLPDMKLPIQYALFYPHRRPGFAPQLNLAKPLHARVRAGRFEAVSGVRTGARGGQAGRHSRCSVECRQRGSGTRVFSRRIGILRNIASLPTYC